MIFRPDADGATEQRIFHLQAVDPATGKDVADERMLFEMVVKGNGAWITPPWQNKTLLNCEKLYPFGPWYRVTAVYDGKTLKNYVGDELQGEGEVHLVPQRPGRSSMGVRINMLYYYKGGMYAARFTRSALGVQDFMKVPVAGSK